MPCISSSFFPVRYLGTSAGCSRYCDRYCATFLVAFSSMHEQSFPWHLILLMVMVRFASSLTDGVCSCPVHPCMCSVCAIPGVTCSACIHMVLASCSWSMCWYIVLMDGVTMHMILSKGISCADARKVFGVVTTTLLMTLCLPCHLVAYGHRSMCSLSVMMSVFAGFCSTRVRTTSCGSVALVWKMPPYLLSSVLGMIPCTRLHASPHVMVLS